MRLTGDRRGDNVRTMAEPQTASPPPTTARASFTILARLCAKLQPPERAKALADKALALGDLAGDLPLSPVELADAYAALGAGYGTEPRPLRARRQECVDLATLLAISVGKVAGARAPSPNAMRVWSWIHEDYPGDAKIQAEAGREFIELVGVAAVRVIGRGDASVKLADGSSTAYLSTADTGGRNQIDIASITVGRATYSVPVPVVVSQQAAIHKLVHPWAAMGLRLGDAGHGHAVAGGGR